MSKCQKIVLLHCSSLPKAQGTQSTECFDSFNTLIQNRKLQQALKFLSCVLCLCLTPRICNCICLSYLYYDFHDIFPNLRHKTYSLSSSRHQNASRVDGVGGREGPFALCINIPGSDDDNYVQVDDLVEGISCQPT